MFAKKAPLLALAELPELATMHMVWLSHDDGKTAFKASQNLRNP